MFRTDRGDDEPSGNHFDDPNEIDNCEDMPGDDDVDITIRGNGDLLVKYRSDIDGPCRE